MEFGARDAQRIHAMVAPMIGGRYPQVAPWRAEYAWQGAMGEAPVVHLEDVSGIPFVDGVPGVEEYQHRARVRASAGDIVVTTTPPQPGYEEYCQLTLGMGVPEYVVAEITRSPTAVAHAATHGSAFARLTEIARERGALALHPYMGIEDVWSLARALKGATGADVRVLAPAPEALWVANDKLALDDLARAIGLEDFLVDTRAVRSPEGLTETLRASASRFERVGLKRTRCASAMGNEVFVAADIVAEPEERTRARVDAFLERTQWPGDEDVMVVEWIDTPLSPSTQLWIPALSSGLPPRLDGIYEQLLYGVERTFLGSRPSTLSPAVHEDLAKVSLMLASAFQVLGYVGRCSFDFIVAHEDDVRLTECNGRWGGTSTPMHLVDRLMPGPRPAYLAQDVVHDALVGVPFAEVLSRAGEHAFDVRTGEGRFVFYNPGPLVRSGKVDVVAVGDDPEHAWALAKEVLPELLTSRASARR